MKRFSGIFKAAVSALASLLLIVSYVPIARAAGNNVIYKSQNEPLYNALHAAPYNLDTSPCDNAITDLELTGLTGDLWLASKGITNGESLQYCTNITGLNLAGNHGIDLSFLSGHQMTRLEELAVNDCGLTSLPASLNMPALTALNAAANPDLANLDSLQTLTTLTSLELSWCNNLTDSALSHLYTLTHLTSLKARNCDIRSLAPFASLNSLQTLDLIGNASLTESAASPTDLHLMTGLTKLKLQNCAFTCFAGLKSLGHLQELDISNSTSTAGNNRFGSITENLSTLASLKNLCMGYVPFGPATDWSNLKTLPALESVDFGHTGVRDVGFLSGVSSLRVLGLDGCGITDADLGCLTGLTPLTTLYLNYNNGITRLANLPNLPNVTWLGMGGCQSLADLAGISRLPGLQVLFISDCCVSDLTPLSALANLNTLGVSSAYIDPTPGSDDRAVIDTVDARAGGYVSIGDQCQINIHYSAPHGTSHKPQDTGFFYGQKVTLPVVDPDAGYKMTGWDTDGDGVADKQAGAEAAVTPPLPVTEADPDLNKKITYTAVCAPLATNSLLDGISLSPSPLSLTPAFDPAVTDYAVSLPSAVGSVTITPAADAPKTYQIDGESAASKTVSLANNETKTVHITCVAEDGTHTSAYTLAITRAPLDSNNRLAGISLSPSSLSLSPAFDPNATAYAVSLPATLGSVTLTPQKPPLASMTIDGSPAATSAVAAPDCGKSQIVTIAVTAEDGSGPTTYTITVKRGMPGANRLLKPGNSAGALSPAFDPYKTSYTLTLGENTASVKLAPVKAKSTSRLYINGALTASKTFSLKPGKSTTVTIKVVPKTGSAIVYKVVIKRKPISNAYLKSLTAGYPLSPAFKKSAYAYTVNLPAGKAGVTVKAVKADAGATVTINGTATSSKYIAVGYGQTKVVTIVVKAQAGNKKTYKVTLIRPPKP